MSGKPKARLDVLVAERGLAESQTRAAALILAGSILVNGQAASKPGQAVAAEARLELRATLPYVSRGGIKLAGALDHFALQVRGRTALDVGASTGGFTDCLLQRGAAKVYAVDVGKGLLHWKLRQDPRVKVLEEINARYLDSALVPEPVDLATVDVSFISLDKILPPVSRLLQPRGFILALVKPQFEVGKGEVGKGGVVRDAEKQKQAVERIAEFARSLGLEAQGLAPAQIKGPKGNQEYFLYLRAGPGRKS
jgi:23S rRNA (cytidine1920-2'-O)/16S rRNA (cytidine1409-2'-O)-methyltransferase